MSLKFISTSCLIGLLCILLFRATFLFKTEKSPKSCLETSGHQPIKLDEVRLKRFQDALNIPTISYEQGLYESEQLQKLIDFIEISYPSLHRAPFVTRELISNYTILYTVRGSNTTLRPYMLTSHLDVVPVVREKWSIDPFNASVRDDNYIYARGTIDAKHLLMSILEAVDYMIIGGFKPQRTIYLVFGHDEEVGGEGAQHVAKVLEERLRQNKWNQLEFILDEGNIITSSRVPGIDSNIAMIGVVEKGYLTVKLSVSGTVGHGSMPPPATAITKLASIAAKFHSHLLPSFFGSGVEKELFNIFAAHSSWPLKIVYSNFWFFKPILEYIFSSDPTLNSLIRTSTAVTMISGGTKDNVLPDSASVWINHRIHPKQTCSDVIAFDKSIVNDPTVKVEVYNHYSNPTPTSLYCEECYGWQLVKQSLLQVHPGTIVVPSMFLAGSDSRHYQNLSDSIYKFSAIVVDLEEMKRFHGHDERISTANYEGLINFFHHLVLNSDSPKLSFRSSHRDEL